MTRPSTITALAASSRDPQRVLVKVNGKVAARLSVKQVVALELVAGMAWDDALAARVAEAAAYDQAMRDALRRLNRRAMSRAELDRKLREREHEPMTRQRVLDRLEELGLLNDQAYGRALIRDITARRAAGPRLLQQKLRQKGLDRVLVDRLVAEMRDDPERDPAAEAVELARKRLRSMQRLESMARKRRIYGLLARRGFEPPVIDAVMQTLREELNAPPV